jgi:hypothetical protein
MKKHRAGAAWIGIVWMAFSSFAFAQEQSGDAERTRLRGRMRQMLLREYRYTPETSDASIATTHKPAQDTILRPSDESDAVILERITVVDTYDFRELEKAVNSPHPPKGPQNTRKFGTGIRQRDFGKVRLSTVSVFYIPIFIGASW